MTTDIPLALQTIYADLLDRAASAAFDDAFPEDGTFTSKVIRGRRYWYFQASTQDGRQQRYVGPETPELLDRITHHKHSRESQRDRRALVSTLIRSARLPRPPGPIGEIVAAFANAGAFRLRGVLVGTVAYQTYSAMLGVRLSATAMQALQTSDVDIAQFADVSIAIGDSIPPVFDVLKKVDPSFRPAPRIQSNAATSYESDNGLRVDFLTPNKGADTDAPRHLPALATDAQQLRFLDFLIRDPEPAVLLHGPGVYVSVPAPQRFAVHKLIVSRRRRAGSAKQEKDTKQAEALLDVLSTKRPFDLSAAWHEAYGRGKGWRQPLEEGLSLIQPSIRDRTLKAVDGRRAIVPGLQLSFATPAAQYDERRDAVTFLGAAGGTTIRCAVTREALEDQAEVGSLDKEGCLKTFRNNRSKFERYVQHKYLSWPVEEENAVLIRAQDREALDREIS